MNPRRLFLGAILPIPLYFVGAATFSFRSLIRNPEGIPILALLWIGYGILIMGIPSILYSLAIEFLRVKENANLAVCMLIGSVLGFVSGSIFFFWSAQLVVLYTMSLPGAVIGGIIPLLLPDYSNKTNRSMAGITTTYLEMRERGHLSPGRSGDACFRILEATVEQWEFSRFLYILVGEAWGWRDKLSWSDECWKAYVESEAITTFVGYYDGSPAGYFELSSQGKEVQIAYFGLTPRFIGKGLGGELLTRAIEEAWNLNPTRVWVHTCSLDHPAALRNYLSRGMTVYKTEMSEPGHPLQEAPMPDTDCAQGV